MGNSRSKSSASTPSTSSQSSNFSTAATVVAAAAGAYVAYKATTNSTVTATQNSTYASFNGPAANGTSSTRISSRGQFGITTHIPAVPPTHIPAVPVAIEASRLVIFDANNYVINNDSSCGDNCEFIPVINGVSYRQRVDKFSMRICPQYNSTKGCHFDHCYRFHVCQFWVKGDCKKSDCSYSHSLDGTHNVPLLQPHMRRNFGEAQLLESLQKGSFVSKAKHGDNRDYICMAHIFRKCTFKDCTSHHISSQFMWEISIGDKWERFPQKQNFELEKSFCDSKNSSVVLSKLSSLSNNGQVKQTLLNQALGDSSCTVEFEMLQLTSTRSFFRIRRLSTPSDILQSKSVATRWLWYWQESSDVWHAFSSGTLHSNFNGTENNYFIIPLSDHLEFSFWKGNMEVSVTINDTRYDLNLEHKTQLNLSTGNLRLIRRRPMFIENTERWNSNNTYRSIWTNTNYDSVNFGRVDVSSSSPEYTFVCSMLKKTLPLISSIKVQRIENPHQWESYQLKKKQYLDKYNGSLNDVNEQYLFHGTKCSVVDNICADSFDWRLFGSNVGNVYGRGTYFSNLASLSDSYASVDDDGFQCMFIAFVLVGLATIGNTGMTIPPKNPAAKKRFDTTVNDNSSPSIFVKYDLDEYYPAYFLRYKR